MESRMCSRNETSVVCNLHNENIFLLKNNFEQLNFDGFEKIIKFEYLIDFVNPFFANLTRGMTCVNSGKE